jgi:hypothetical protein
MDNGKGILIHSLTDAAGMPLTTHTAPANGNERAQVMPLLDAIHLHTGKHGRPRTRPKISATNEGCDAKDLRWQLHKRAIRAQMPKRVWQPKRPCGRPLTINVPCFQAERAIAWFPKKY